ncbi:MAG: signal peptidase II [Candidatus Nanopelagicales bacterium]|nr:signal peptidase II [Candidatus Nanopelagicales bacterium]
MSPRIALISSVAGLAILADWTIKTLVVESLSNGSSIDLGFINIKLAYNPGVAFSLGSWLPPIVVTIGTGIIISGGFILLVLRARTLNAVSTAGAALLLGGALGNFIDRLDGQGVVDYFHTGWFATFNLADALITVGVVLLATGLVTNGPRQMKWETESSHHDAMERQRSTDTIIGVDGCDDSVTSQ